MHELTRLIAEDMKPALGVTEPGAIAYAVATAREHTKGTIQRVKLRLNSGMYKNAFTCGIPGIRSVGNLHAAALGAIGADPKKKLECLDGITAKQAELASKMVEQGMIQVEISEITSRIFIEATVITDTDTATVTIRDAHTNIVQIRENDQIVYELAYHKENEDQAVPTIHRYTLAELAQYVKEVPIDEIEFIEEAFKTNYDLALEGLQCDRTTYALYLFHANGDKIISKDEQKTASLLCNAAIEARVIGLNKPAMSITGSGAHGIIATMPLYACALVNGYPKEELLRATALSALVCMYIKEYSGKLSAFCGCAIAAGTGMACGLVYLKHGTIDMMAHAINNLASSITGMICDGGNQGCTMKGVVAVDSAWQSVNMVLSGVYIFDVHGINGSAPEETMRNMGRIASPGMVKTEQTILDILEEKDHSKGD